MTVHLPFSAASFSDGVRTPPNDRIISFDGKGKEDCQHTRMEAIILLPERPGKRAAVRFIDITRKGNAKASLDLPRQKPFSNDRVYRASDKRKWPSQRFQV